MSRTLRIHHPKHRLEYNGFGLSDLLIDAAYVLGFLTLLGLMLMPYINRFF